ncbi:Hypothetical protein NTJ_06075 [Nesidiocoris tenuis]|uniref:Uncharacterized protein n=1 Tax=Nesidiocoris tenuis TaxID=355587 RepID=A0ABN7ALZ7_9HEMI|nr:Hypothetical protein NTJ_06075 [Nesidiocoris tenuis]
MGCFSYLANHTGHIVETQANVRCEPVRTISSAIHKVHAADPEQVWKTRVVTGTSCFSARGRPATGSS